MINSLSAGLIAPFPDIPEELRLAARRGNLVPFVGAGVSQLAGCPGWDEFANRALKFFVDSGKLSHAQYDQMAKLSSRIKLSLALDLERQHSQSIDFRALLRHQDNQQLLGQRAYDAIAKIGITIATTNYDEWLDAPAPDALRVTPSAEPLSAEQSRFEGTKRKCAGAAQNTGRKDIAAK